MATTRGTAVVTGAGRGLGAAIATMLVTKGFTVEVTDVDGDAARTLATQLGTAAYGSGLDVRDPAACRELAERVDAAGRLDLWVNNAGVLTTAPTWEHDDAQRQLIMDVNAHGTMNGTLAALAPMRRRGRGHIVNVVSLAGLVAVQGEGVYAASKHAALAFSLSTLTDLRAAGERGISISCICPDGIWTPMLQGRLEDPEAALSFSGKLLQPEEVVAVVEEVLVRPRPVTTIPRWRGVQLRLGDTFPRLLLAALPLVRRHALGQQRRLAARLGGR